MRSKYKVRPGRRFPAGASVCDDGVNFSVFSRHATAATLLLYASADAVTPLQRIVLDRRENRDYFFWNIFVEGASPGLCYTWLLDGPRSPESGMLFDPENELLDPWAGEVDDRHWQRAAWTAGDLTAIRAKVVADEAYDWAGDEPLERPLQDEIIYELHVGGFTKHPSAGVEQPGTFSGLAAKIPYLQRLGVTAVELLPVMAFDEQDVPPGAANLGLSNFWGYSPYGFYALHPRYASGTDIRREFRDLVAAMHRAGIAVILDVVFNHTAEGGVGGPVLSFKGFGNETFYHLDQDDPSLYRDYTGCGNSLNCNHPFVMQFIVQCLEYWVTHMHVDGFRFDLGSVMTRMEDGEPSHHAPLIWAIELSPVLRSRVLISEAWDAAGLYQVGNFPGLDWSEWNGRYRDAMRRYLRGEPGMIGEVATRISGSSDLYSHNGRKPANSINFVTCHDGYTLLDLVSYEHKHNEANGEENRDGSNHEMTWNSGHEGETDDPQINRLRQRRARNFMALLMLSQGVPMFPAGDEFLRTQKGNNNVYCQDNELGWLDWSETPSGADMFRFTAGMIALRRRHPSLRRKHFVPRAGPGEQALHWSGADGKAPDWHDHEARVLCFTLAGLEKHEPALHVMINMSFAAVDLPLPKIRWARWYRIVDTALTPPDDIVEPELSVKAAKTYCLEGMTVAVFEAL